jgi:hypothetical protein
MFAINHELRAVVLAEIFTYLLARRRARLAQIGTASPADCSGPAGEAEECGHCQSERDVILSGE